MPRLLRLKENGQKTCYHVMSRSVLDGFPLGDQEKDELVKIIKQFSRLFFVEVLGFCIMGNHWHAVIKIFPDSYFTNDQILDRYKAFYGEDREIADDWYPAIRNRLSNLSDFMKEIKQTFSRY